MVVTVPVSVPKSVMIVAVSPEMLVTVVPIEASEVWIVPSEVVMFAFCPAIAPMTAFTLSSSVFIDPTLVCTVATPLLMLEIEPLMPEMVLLRPDTDDVTPWMLVFIVPIELLSVAVFPFMAISVAFMAERVVWIVPVAVWIVTTVPQMAVTLAPMPANVTWSALTVVLV